MPSSTWARAAPSLGRQRSEQANGRSLSSAARSDSREHPLATGSRAGRPLRRALTFLAKGSGPRVVNPPAQSPRAAVAYGRGKLPILESERARMRFPIRLWAALILAAWASTGSAHAQTGFDRRGGDYLNFQVRNGDPAVCAARCERDARCRAWSFSYPRTANAIATCWLKNQVPTRTEDKCCVSGVRGAGVIEPRKGPIEYSIDRFGGDYRSLEITTDAAGAPCKAACEADNKCRAWTYVRPGYIGGAARCYLKDHITRPRSKPCCISGVVR